MNPPRPVITKEQRYRAAAIPTIIPSDTASRGVSVGGRVTVQKKSPQEVDFARTIYYHFDAANKQKVFVPGEALEAVRKIYLKNVYLKPQEGFAAGDVAFLRFSTPELKTTETRLTSTTIGYSSIGGAIPVVVGQQLNTPVLLADFPVAEGRLRADMRLEIFDDSGTGVAATGFIALETVLYAHQ